MPTLIIEQPGNRTGGRLAGRVLIGRLPTNGIVLADSSVSRLHAWIDRERDGQYYVADTGSLTGTRVNGRPIERRQDLHDGDVVRVGQTQIVFSEEAALPRGVQELNLAGQPALENVAEAGVLFDCPCGAPAWFKAAVIGQAHKCRHCGRTIRIPERSGVFATTVAEAPEVPEPGVPVAAERHEHEGMLAQDFATAIPAHEHAHADEHGLSDSIVQGEWLAEAPTHDAVAEAEPLIEEPPVSHEQPPAEGSNGEARHDHLFENWRPGEERLPEPAEVTAPAVADAPPMHQPATQTCSVCQTEIAARESMTTCPSCGLTFHTECWEENRGCSAYGCPQVGALAKPGEEQVKEAEPAEVQEQAATTLGGGISDEEPAGFPWEFLFLATSVLGVLMGAFAYGVPAAIAAVGTVTYLLGFKETRKRRGVLVVALLVCVAGAALGLWFSYRWYHGWPPPVARWLGRGGGRA